MKWNENENEHENEHENQHENENENEYGGIVAELRWNHGKISGGIMMESWLILNDFYGI